MNEIIGPTLSVVNKSTREFLISVPPFTWVLHFFLLLFQLPYFMNELTLTELDMGLAAPKVLRASKPSIDYRGKR